MPGDDHCFFNCIIHQLVGITPECDGFYDQVMQLRHEVVEFLRIQIFVQNDLMDSLYMKAIVIFAPLMSHVRKDLMVLSYLTLLEKKEWADYECIVAVIQLKGICIKLIDFETGALYEFGDTSLCCIYLVYCNRNHYNSVKPIITPVRAITLYISSLCYFVIVLCFTFRL